LTREEEVDPSSTLGLLRYKREPYAIEPEERLKHRMAFGLLVLLALVLLISLVGNIVVAVTGGDAGSLNGLSNNADNLGLFGWFATGRAAAAVGSAAASGSAAGSRDGGWLGRPDDDDRLGG
jgi:hypothetical protein